MSPLKKSMDPSIETQVDDLSVLQEKQDYTTPRNVVRLSFIGDECSPVEMNAGDDHSVSSMTVDEGKERVFTLDAEQAEREIFVGARHYLNPGPFFRYIIYLFAERKLLVFSAVHFACTMVIWSHFFFIKFEEKLAAVPEGVPRYWWKRIVPPLEFATMHAVLFQMALIPLTMTRYSISSLSESVINRFIPLNRTIRMHIHLGYTIIMLLIVSTMVFFLFFGLLCSDGDQAFCDKFRSEIMCTGYGIIATLLIILGTSYFRHKIPYEIFYAVHHLVFIFYAITIAHTLDDKQRSGESQRAQTFKWFSATLVYYLCDRAAMYLNHRYKARLVSSSTIEGSTGCKMIILRLRRNDLFCFKPGQFAYLRLSTIDSTWHPFSIASGPASDYLEFYIEVFGTDSWTSKLWDLLEGDEDDGLSEKHIEFEVLGPCGTSLAKTDDFSHAVAIGTGTGIVPILSLYKQHVRQLLRLDPSNHFADLQRHRKKMLAAERAMAPRKGSIAKKIASFLPSPCPSRYMSKDLDAATCAAKGPDESMTLAVSLKDKIHQHERMMRWRDVRGSIKDMKCEAFIATRSIYGVVSLAFLPVFGTMLLGLTISWNTIDVDLKRGMVEFLKAFTTVFQLVFAFVALGIWDGNHLFAYTDAAVCIVAPFADWYWFIIYNTQGKLQPGDVTTFCLMIGYMTARAWGRTVKPRHQSWRHAVKSDGIGALDSLDIVWVSRSASLVSEILPDITKIYDSLAAQWGRENAAKVCKISVYVTDKDEHACELLRRELTKSRLYQDGAINFGRPDFARLIENHTLKMICTRKKSYSLLAFCGSPEVAQEINHHKISNDMITAITGNKAHQMEFVSESYGGCVCKREKEEGPDDIPMANMDSLTTRTVISYYPTKAKKFLL